MFDVCVLGPILKEHPRRGGVRGPVHFGGPALEAARAYARAGRRTLLLSPLAPRDAEAALRPLAREGVTVRTWPVRRTPWLEHVYRGRDEVPRATKVLAEPVPVPGDALRDLQARLLHWAPFAHADLPDPGPETPRVLHGSALTRVVRAGYVAEEPHPEFARWLAGTRMVLLTLREALLLARASMPGDAARFLRAEGVREVLLLFPDGTARLYGEAGTVPLPAAAPPGAALAARALASLL